MISSLILSLAKGIWFIEPSAAEGYKPVVKAILSGQKVDFSALLPKAFEDDGDNELKKDKFQKFAFINCQSQLSVSNNINSSTQGVVAITPLSGVVMKDDWCGEPGTKTLNAWMLEADRNENVIAHILLVDSPGGSADATLDFSESIKSMNKPVITFVDGLMASAAYWIGSSAKHIMASNALNQIGSIGAYQRVLDFSGKMEKDGIKEHIVYATESTEKNKDIRELLAGNPEPMRAVIDQYNNAFMASVKRNRFGKNLNESQTLKGQLYLTDKALEFGLIDSVGSLADAVQLAINSTKS